MLIARDDEGREVVAASAPLSPAERQEIQSLIDHCEQMIDITYDLCTSVSRARALNSKLGLLCLTLAVVNMLLIFLH